MNSRDLLEEYSTLHTQREGSLCSQPTVCSGALSCCSCSFRRRFGGGASTLATFAVRAAAVRARAASQRQPGGHTWTAAREARKPDSFRFGLPLPIRGP